MRLSNYHAGGWQETKNLQLLALYGSRFPQKQTKFGVLFVNNVYMSILRVDLTTPNELWLRNLMVEVKFMVEITNYVV